MRFQIESGEGREGAAEAQQFLIELPERAVRAILALAMRQCRAVEGGGIVRVGHLTLPAKEANSARRPSRTAAIERRVAVAGEILEGLRLAVLLAHEEERHEGREEHRRRRQFLPLIRDDVAEAVARRAVADLIVILGADDEPPALGGQALGCRAAAAGASSTCPRRRTPRGTPARDQLTPPKSA